VPGVPAPSADRPAVGSPTPAPTPKADAPAKAVLPVGNVEAAQKEVARLNGLRGGRPRKDGLIPGSPEAKERDNKDAKDRMQRLRDNRRASTLPPLPAAPTPEPGQPPSATNPAQTIPVDFAGGVPAPVIGWTPADLQPVVENAIAVGEEWDALDNRKILEPLGLDAAAQSRILSPTRWPQSAKLGLQKGGAESLSEIFNITGVPTGIKKHLLSLPAAAYLFQHIKESKGELKKLVAEEMRKKRGETKPEPPAEAKP